MNRVIDQILPDLPYDNHAGTRTQCNANFNLKNNFQNVKGCLNVYTDGSKDDEGAGFGWAVTVDNLIVGECAKRVNLYNSVFQTELAAIGDVVTWLLNYIPLDNNRNVFIFSDSLSAIMALQNPIERSAEVQRCKGLINRLHARNRTVVCWIKGHAEHTGNELADVKAKEGAAGAPFHDIPAPLRVAKKAISDQMINFWQNSWDDVAGHRQTKLFIGTVTKEIHPIIIQLPRRQLSQVVGWITGHATLNRHLQIMGLSNDNWCRACKRAPETPHHIIFDCVRFEETRYAQLANQDYIYDDPDRGPLIRVNMDEWTLAERIMNLDNLVLILCFMKQWNNIFVN